jgi:hypothetical protein
MNNQRQLSPKLSKIIEKFLQVQIQHIKVNQNDKNEKL